MADVWVPGWTIKRFTDPKSFLASSNEIACAHTQVGGWPGSWNWGNQDGNPYAQSYLKCDGEGVNAWPVNLRSAANLKGNHRVWAIETEDVDADCFAPWNLTCGNVPAWTDAQVQTLIEGLAWWCIRFRRPPVIIPDAKPGRVGLGYHRFGVPNSPEWVTGAEQWTRSEGKCCPDWRRIAQFRNEVVPGVAAIVNNIGEDDMANSDEIYKQTTEILKALRYDPGTANTEDEVGKRIKRTDEKVADVYTQTTEILKALRWDPTVANTEDDLGARVKRTEEQVAEILAILKAQ